MCYKDLTVSNFSFLLYLRQKFGWETNNHDETTNC